MTKGASLMRVSKKLEAARAAFRRRVIDEIKGQGAVETNGLYGYTLPTPIGELGISVWDSAIICRFFDVPKAVAFTSRHTSQSCNPHSGKWNWHWSKDDDPVLALSSFKADLDRLTAVQTPPYLEDRKGEACQSNS